MEFFECLHRDKSKDVTSHPQYYCFLPSDEDLMKEEVCKKAMQENISEASTPNLPPCFPFHTRKQ